MLFAFRLSKLHLDCLWTVIAPLPNLKFHFLPFCKGLKVHLLKLVAMEEEVCVLLCLDKSKPPVCD